MQYYGNARLFPENGLKWRLTQPGLGCNLESQSQTLVFFGQKMGKEASISVSREVRQELLFRNGRVGRPDELSEFIEGAVAAGGVIDPVILAQEIGCASSVILEHLTAHPLTESFRAGNGQYKFCSLLPPPKPTEEGMTELEELKLLLTEDPLGAEARLEYYRDVQERTLMSKHMRKSRQRMVRRF